MTGRINYTPEARQQLNELDDWIAKAASADISQRFVSAIFEHIDGFLVFPLAGRVRDDVRPGLRTSTFRKRTLVAYEVDESSGELVVNILGGRLITHPCVANAWQEDRRRPSTINGHQRVSAGQPHNANDVRLKALSVPHFPHCY